jgi:hypothetical protein
MKCKNCNTTLSLENNYCNTCGAKVIRNRLTLKSLFSDFIETYLNYDNKFIQTFINLFKKPEDVIGNYINGTRKKYVNVIGYFTIAITFTGLEYFIVNRFFPDFLDISYLSQKGMETFANNILHNVQENQSFVLLLFVPLYAFMAKLVFFNIKKFNYTELLVIFMYIIAQINILGSLVFITVASLGLKIGVVSPFIFVFQIVYSTFCLKRLYNLSFSGIILRALFFLVILLIFYIISVFSLVGIMYLIKGPDFFKNLIEIQKAASST